MHNKNSKQPNKPTRTRAANWGRRPAGHCGSGSQFDGDSPYADARFGMSARTAACCPRRMEPDRRRAHRVRRTKQVRSRPPCHILRRFCDVDRSNGCPPTIRYHDQVAKRISGPIPLRRNREPPSRDDAADCWRVWLHPRCTQSQLFVFERKLNVVGRNQTDQK